MLIEGGGSFIDGQQAESGIVGIDGKKVNQVGGDYVIDGFFLLQNLTSH